MSGNVERGWAALNRNRYDVAEKEFRGVLAENPDDAQIHAALGLCLCEMEKFDAAENEAKLAIGLAPDSDFTHYVHGRILLDRHRYKEALTASEQAIRLDPDDANNRSLQASIYLRMQRWEDCLASANAGLAIDAEHEGCTNLRALSLTQLGRKEEAAATISGALERSPENSLTHTNQGWALLHRNQPKQALEHFREALRLDPSNDWAREGLLTALKAHNVVFRSLLAFFMFMSRQSTTMRWVLIIGVIFGQRFLNSTVKTHPELGFILYPLIALIGVMIYSTWLANPLMNLIMRFDPHGRHALTKDQYQQANLVGACLLLAAGLFSLEMILGLGHLPSLLLLLLTIPVTSIHDAAEGWPRRLSVIAACTFALIAAFEIFAIHFVRLSFIQKQIGELDVFLVLAAAQLINVYFYGILIWAILVMAWINRAQPTR